MCKFCVGRIKTCPCKGHIITNKKGESPRYSYKTRKITNQKGAFGTCKSI